jgi:hypothetical protein
MCSPYVLLYALLRQGVRRHSAEDRALSNGLKTKKNLGKALDMRKTDGTWKISRFYEAPQLLMPESVTQVHKKD